jgi:hypothetical protein
VKTYDLAARDFAKKFREVEERRPLAVARGMLSAALLGAEVLARAAPKDLKMLARSIRGTQESKGAQITIDAPYAGIVELGSRPHWAPIRPLLEWAKRHATARDAMAFAHALQQKIAREGTAPTYFVRRSLPALRKILKLEVERELAAEDEK